MHAMFRAWSRGSVYSLLSVAFALAVGACSKAPLAHHEPLQVAVVIVQAHDVPLFSDFVGSLDGLVNAEIRARVPGYLQSVDYKEGAKVTAGQLLFTIDPVLVQASARQAGGQLESAQANLDKASTDLTRDKAQLAAGVLSQQDLDHANAAWELAKGQLLSAQGGLQTAKANVGFSRVTSPINGIAGLAKVRVGNLVAQGEPTLLTTVSQLDPIRASFTISEDLYLEKSRELETLLAASHGLEAGYLELILSDGFIYPRRGILSAVDRAIDPTTGTITLQAYFPNPDLTLRPGQFAKVRARTSLEKGAFSVPQRAVRELQGVYQLGVVGADHCVQVRAVTVGARVGSEWIIVKGIAAGDAVIVEGLDKVKTGDLVQTWAFVAGKGGGS